MERKHTCKRTKKLQHVATVVAEPETSRRQPPLRKSVCDDETEEKLENITLPQSEIETPRTGTVRGRQPELEGGKTSPGRMEINSNALGQMIATIIKEISKDAGGLANFSRSLVSNSINDGQTGQPHVSMDLEENESHLHQNPEFKKPELNAALAVIKKTMKLDAAIPFNKPVDPVALGIPDYFDVIDTPMDFGTICNNLENGLEYRNASDVFKDVQWIWYNCLKYNKKGDYILGLMKRVKSCFMKYWKAAALDTEQTIVAASLAITGNVHSELKSGETSHGKKKNGKEVSSTNRVVDNSEDKGTKRKFSDVAKGNTEGKKKNGKEVSSTNRVVDNSEDKGTKRKFSDAAKGNIEGGSKKKVGGVTKGKVKGGTSKTKEGAKKMDGKEAKGKEEVGTSNPKGKEKMTREIISRQRALEDEDSDFDEPQTVKKIKGGKGNIGSINHKGTSVANSHIRIRTSPKPLSAAMLSLSDSQKECLENLGFAPLLRFRMDAIPWKLGYFVVDSFDEKKMEIKLKRGVIKITKNSIFEMIGVPLGGKPIESLEIPEEEDKIVVDWRKQFEKKDMTSNEVMKKILLSKEADWNFILNFVILFVNTMGHTMTRGKCDLSVLKYFNKDTNIKNIDWCDYIFNSLKNCKKGWRKDDNNSFFAGPITVLTLLYVDGTVCRGIEVNRARPVLCNWTTELLKQRESTGRFWEAEIVKEYIQPFEEEGMVQPFEEESMEHHHEEIGKNSLNLQEAGPSNVQLLYVDGTVCRGIQVNRARPVLCNWTTELLKQRESGRFWEAKIVKKYIQPFEEESMEHHHEEIGKYSLNVHEAGPSNVQLLYVDGNVCRGIQVNRARPVLCNWTTELLKQRESTRRFWEANIVKKYIQPFEEESMEHHHEEIEKDSLNVQEAGPSDVEGYVTKMETLLQSIMADKAQLVKTAKEAQSKFPKNPMIDDWGGKVSMFDEILKDMYENLKGI